jgi:hypothetical protein
MAQQGGGDGADVHGVAHGRGGTAVARDGFGHHGGRHVVLAQPAQILRHQETEQTLLCQGFEVLAREQEMLVALDGVLTQRRVAQRDQLFLDLFLRRGQQPLRIEFVPQTPKILGSPLLDVSHAALLFVGADGVRCSFQLAHRLSQAD